MLHTFAFCCFCCFHLVDAVKSVSVMEGDSVTLDIHVTEIQDINKITWTFGTDGSSIAKISRGFSKIFIFDDVPDGRFRGRMKVDNQTGSLTITNTRTTDSGVYEVDLSRISSSPTAHRFTVTVYARLSIPNITRDCSLVCSVVNVSHVTLSWYKGNSLLSSISASDLSISLSLPLEVEYQDKNTYSCVLNNPISHQTRHPNITQLCHTCAEVHAHCCGSAEAVIRLVVTALMGVAAAAAAVLLLNDIRTTRVKMEKTEQVS